MEGMTRKRKWMFGLLALGVGALVLDRTLLGPPAEASASDTAVDGEDSNEAAVETVADRGDAAPVPVATGAAGDRPADLSGFAQRLSSMPSSREAASDRADAFQVPAAWKEQPLTGPIAMDEPRELSARALAFQAKYKHNGTIIVPEAGIGEQAGMNVYIAVINGNRCPVGTELDGFRLVRVANGRSLWESVEGDEFFVIPPLDEAP